MANFTRDKSWGYSLLHIHKLQKKGGKTMLQLREFTESDLALAEAWLHKAHV